MKIGEKLAALIFAAVAPWAMLAGPSWSGEMAFSGREAFPLVNGINEVDLNGDGVSELVIKSRRRNFNAHGYSIYQILIEVKNVSGKSEWNIVPILNDQGYYRHDRRTSEGADCILSDIRLLAGRGEGKTAPLLIVGEREFEKTYVDKEKVNFYVYRLEKNHQEAAGTPAYYFRKHDIIRSKNKYCDVNEAFSVELGLG